MNPDILVANEGDGDDERPGSAGCDVGETKMAGVFVRQVMG